MPYMGFVRRLLVTTKNRVMGRLVLWFFYPAVQGGHW